MANKWKGEVEFSIGEDSARQVVVLRYGINEMIQLHEHFAQQNEAWREEEAFFKALAAGEIGGLRNNRTLLRYGLVAWKKDVTDEEAGFMLTQLGPLRFSELVAEAMKWALPTPPEKGAPEGKEQAASPGEIAS